MLIIYWLFILWKMFNQFICSFCCLNYLFFWCVKPFALYFLDIYSLLDSWQIVSHSSGHLFTWFSFTVQKPFSLMQYHCQRLWFSGLLECFSEGPFLGCVCRCFILVFFLQLTLRFIWTDFFPMGGDMDLVSILHMWLFSFSSTICWRSDIFFIFYFWYVCQKIRWLTWVYF